MALAADRAAGTAQAARGGAGADAGLAMRHGELVADELDLDDLRRLVRLFSVVLLFHHLDSSLRSRRRGRGQAERGVAEQVPPLHDRAQTRILAQGRRLALADDVAQGGRGGAAAQGLVDRLVQAALREGGRDARGTEAGEGAAL